MKFHTFFLCFLLCNTLFLNAMNTGGAEPKARSTIRLVHRNSTTPGLTVKGFIKPGRFAHDEEDVDGGTLTSKRRDSHTELNTLFTQTEHMLSDIVEKTRDEMIDDIQQIVAVERHLRAGKNYKKTDPHHYSKLGLAGATVFGLLRYAEKLPHGSLHRSIFSSENSTTQTFVNFGACILAGVTFVAAVKYITSSEQAVMTTVQDFQYKKIVELNNEIGINHSKILDLIRRTDAGAASLVETNIRKQLTEQLQPKCPADEFKILLQTIYNVDASDNENNDNNLNEIHKAIQPTIQQTGKIIGLLKSYLDVASDVQK